MPTNTSANVAAAPPPATTQQQQQQQPTKDDPAALPQPEIPSTVVAQRPTPVPSAVAFAPDDSVVTFLERASAANPDVRTLYSLDCATLEMARPDVQAKAEDSSTASYDALSLEEKLRLERQRLQAVGITSYAWCASAKKMLVPLGGKWFVHDADKRETTLVVDKTADAALDASFSPDGERVAFVRGDDLWLVRTSSSSTSPSNGLSLIHI